MRTQKCIMPVLIALAVFGIVSVLSTTVFAAETYDLVILNGRVMDPETKLDARRNVGVKDGGLPSTGIPYVLVNGTVVVKDSKELKGVYPGRPIRRSVMQ